jgi:hypothetical protein
LPSANGSLLRLSCLPVNAVARVVNASANRFVSQIRLADATLLASMSKGNEWRVTAPLKISGENIVFRGKQ